MTSCFGVSYVLLVISDDERSALLLNVHILFHALCIIFYLYFICILRVSVRMTN